MEIKIHTIQDTYIAEIISDSVVVNSLNDAVDILGNANYNGAGSVILKKEQLTSDFFDLKTGIAGEILQKFSNYSMKLAIIGDFSDIKSKSLRDFIYESNKVGRINFTASKEEAIRILNK